MSNNQPCKYCGIKIIRWEKLPDGKYLRYDENGLHKYDICKAEQLKRHKTSYQPNHQTQVVQPSKSQISNYVGGTSTFPVDKEPEIRGVTINSLFVKTSNMEKEIKELRKQIETLASIADSIAQKTELVIAKIGYPAPELSQERARREIEEANNKLIQKIRAEQKTTDESGVLLKDGQEIKTVNKDIEAMKERETFYKSLEKEQEIKAVQTHPAQEEVINPMRVQKEEEPSKIVEVEGKRYSIHDVNQESDVMQWQNISEAFLCVSCEGKFHNGFHKLGTRLCPACKDKIESNESEDRDDRSDVNQEFNRVSRSIEEINDDL